MTLWLNPLALHMLLRFRKARGGHAGKVSWRSGLGQEYIGVYLKHEVVANDHFAVHMGPVEVSLEQNLLARSRRLSSRRFTNWSAISASFMPFTMCCRLRPATDPSRQAELTQFCFFSSISGIIHDPDWTRAFFVFRASLRTSSEI